MVSWQESGRVLRRQKPGRTAGSLVPLPLGARCASRPRWARVRRRGGAPRRPVPAMPRGPDPGQPWAMLAADRELSGWRVTMCCPGARVRFQRREVAYRVTAVLALLLHDHAQAAAEGVRLFGVAGCGQARG